LVDEERKVKGSPDFALKLSIAAFMPVEFKSINAAGFERLKKESDAVVNHELQVLYYGRMFKRIGATVPSTAVVYVLKDFKWGVNPYAEFRPTENGRTTPSLDLMDQRAESIRDTSDTGPLPERLSVCPDSTSSRAKSCDQCVMCFSTDQ
jgi:hypothetical protein